MPRSILAFFMVLPLVTGCARSSHRVGQAAAARDSLGALARVQHLVIIFQENRSFDSIWGLWPGVEGLSAEVAETPHQRQVKADGDGTPYRCLPQTDPNLLARPDGPLAADCTGESFRSHFPNALFPVDAYITPESKTCWRPGLPEDGMTSGIAHPKGRPGGCTRDLVHRFYQEQYQINGGAMDRFTVGSSAAGLTQGYYDTRQLPLFRYLTEDASAPPYVILDHFFHAAFGGSYLNHIWLVSARTPEWPDADHSGGKFDLHAVVGSDGYAPVLGEPTPHGVEPGTKDGALTAYADPQTGRCSPPAGAPSPPAKTVCGDFAVNTVQPSEQPFSPRTPVEKRLPALPASHPTIGDKLDEARIGWAWYSGGWDNAAGNTTGLGWTNGNQPGTCTDPRHHPASTYPNCPDMLFQFHHQPFNYFASFGPGTQGREHLKDEADLHAHLRAGKLPAVAFVKLLGPENEHPGYADLASGDRHLVDLIKAIQADVADWPTTAIIVTYDENGGAWDHVSPPTDAASSDRWGPGTRIPAMILSPLLPAARAVDHTSYDTTAILTTIENRFGLPGRLSPRPGVPDLRRAFGGG